MLTKTSSSLLWATILFAALLMFARTAAGQNALQISSPANGTVVNSGQTLTVSVTSPNGTAFSQIAVIGPDPIGFNILTTAAPAQFSIPIPADASSRIYSLTADGIMASGQGVTSAPIRIDIERSDFPQKLFSTTSGLVLESQGEQSPLAMLATFSSDGNTVDVTASTLVSYASSNNGVASVSPNGVVTAMGAGAAIVTATYALSGMNMQVAIPVTVHRPMLSASPTSLSFGNQPIGTSSTPQQLTLTDAATGNVTIQAITPSGDFSETDNCIASSPLTPNNGCTVNVTFSPTAGGTRTGALSVANSANIAPVAVSLSGTGAASTVLFGDSIVENYQDTNVLGQAEAFQTTATASGMLGSLTVYLDQGNTVGQLTIGLYTDNGGDPGTLLTQASTTQMTAGTWNTIPVSPVSITSGVAYWIAILGTQSGTIAFRDNSGPNCGDEGSAQTNLTSLPATWTTGPIWGTCPLSAYGNTQ